MNAHSKPKGAETVEDVLNTLPAPNVHRKLSSARKQFHTLKLKKTGKNTFANYEYFELGDFLIPALDVFDEFGLGATVSFDRDVATMTIRDLDNPDDTITITSPMGSAALKGCHEVQNIGAVETYQRRYLWVAALEIVEHDALDRTTGKSAPEARNNNAQASSKFISQKQCDDLFALASEADVPVQQIKDVYKIDDLAHLPAELFDRAVASLKRAAERNKEPVNA